MCLSDSWKEISAVIFADEISFHGEGTEVQRRYWNRRKNEFR